MTAAAPGGGAAGGVAGAVPSARRSHGDLWRLLWSFAATLPIAFLVELALFMATPDELIEAGTPQLTPAGYVVGFGVSWPVFTIIYGLWTRAVVRASSRVNHRGRVVMRLLGLDAVSLPIWGAVLGIAVVVVLIVTLTLRTSTLVIIGAFATIAASWALMIVAFAVTYLRRWAERDEVAFPDDEPRRFDDFVYLSVQVATTFATSDVTTRSARIRGWVTLNSIIAFVFNTVIIALFLAVASSSVG